MATDTMLVASKSAEGCEVTERGMSDIGLACKKLAIAVSTAVALAGTASAQTAPISPADSTNAPAAKGLGYGQYTKDGREFVKLTDEEVVKLDVREKIAYKKWSIENEKQKTIKEELRLAENREKVIAEYRDYIQVFTDFHTRKGSPGFDTSLYMKMKAELKGVLISGKPPEILPQLEPLRSILMS